MSWLKFLGLLFAHIGSLFVAYRQGSEGAAAEVKANNDAKQAEYAKKKQEVDSLSNNDFIEQLRNGKRDF